jgi:ubiquinone/menaquinone biosynthesis C-methylase UbiE
MGGWWEALIREAAPHPGERILEVSAEGFSTCAVLARDYPAVHFAALQPMKSSKITGELLSNLELLHGDLCGIDCRAASIDKIICSLALHPLPQNGKLAFLKEMRRVLRQGGTLYLAELDQPLQARETNVLRATGYLFGPETATSHYDGTWFDLFKQAGFTSVRRVSSFSEIVGRVTIVRARRG